MTLAEYKEQKLEEAADYGYSLINSNSGTIWIENDLYGETDLADMDVISEDGKIKIVAYQNRRPPFVIAQYTFKHIGTFKNEVKSFVQAVNRGNESFEFENPMWMQN